MHLLVLEVCEAVASLVARMEDKSDEWHDLNCMRLEAVFQ
jgi:hypothetical protein